MRAVAIVALAAQILAGGSVLAADANNRAPDSDRSADAGDWSASLGVFGAFGPEYEGSDDIDVSAFPLVEITWRDRVFVGTRDGLGINVIKDGPFTLSTAVTYAFGRDQDDSGDLNGLGDVDGGAMAVIRGALELDAVDVSAQVAHQFTGDDTGFLGTLGVGYTFASRQGWFLRPGVSTTFASGDHMDAYFSVNRIQSARSGLAVYDADAGFKTIGADLTTGYRFGQGWSIFGNVSYDRLIGDAADSPIVRDENQVSAGLGLSFSF